jgi:hypothetical protein
MNESLLVAGAAPKAFGVACSERLCENSFCDHSIHLLVSSKCAIGQMGAKFFRVREFSHSLAIC